MVSETTSARPQEQSFPVRCALCRTGISESGQLIKVMVGELAKSCPGIETATAIAAIEERELESPTFITSEIAMPHARLECVDEPVVAVATSQSGIVFSPKGRRATMVFLVLTPRFSPAAYLKVAAGLSRRLMTPGFRERCQECTGDDDLLALFHGGGQVRHIVTAGDMMTPPAAVLRETNSVKDAIDTIVRTRLSEIPVVDKEGDMVGVASARALLGICIPEYLLWMEDLSQFSNFEPFESLLRKESGTWLADITDDGFASVGVNQPAIAVAEALARHKAERCFVLDGAKLVGVVTLPNFLNNVFRD